MAACFEDTARVLRGNHPHCARGNGDGLGTTVLLKGEPRESFCLCDLCRVSRWRRREAVSGRLNPDQCAAIDDLIAHILEPPTTEDPVLPAPPAGDPDDAEHAEDFS